jgi:hypothetical protein
MPSIDRLARFVTLRELKIFSWEQDGKAHSVARCEKVSRGEVCPRCAHFSDASYDRRWVKEIFQNVVDERS